MNYAIRPANQEQRERIITLFRLNEKSKYEQLIIYIAEDSHNMPVGRIVIAERDVPSPLAGKRWYVYDLLVHPEHRRKGIATALVKNTIEEAENASIVFLYGSANPSAEASCFWMKQGFSMNAYGRKQDDPGMPLFYGNYYHMFSRSIQRRTMPDKWRKDDARKLSKEEMLRLIDTFMTDPGKKTRYMNKADELTGFAVQGEQGDVIGAIIAFPESMQAPLESVRLIVEVFVKEEYRKQGIGRGLVCQMYRYAKEIGAVQLTNFSQTAEHIGFWYEIGFDVFFWDVNPNSGECGTTAMLRVN